MTYFYRRSDHYLNRFLSGDELQLDPLMAFLTPSLKDYPKLSENDDYYIISLADTNGRIPLFGQTGAYRLSAMKASGLDQLPTYMDNDAPVDLIKHGHNRFAVMKEVGYYHHHVTNLKGLIEKRLR